MSGISINIATGDLSEFAADPAIQSLALTKSFKVSEIEAKRDAATNADVPALGTMWQADERSQKLLSSSITLAAAGLPLPTVWRDSFNNDMPVATIADLLAIAGAMAAQTQEAYAKSWQLKAQVEAAATVAEVNAIIW